jgi:hypothetical protein
VIFENHSTKWAEFLGSARPEASVTKPRTPSRGESLPADELDPKLDVIRHFLRDVKNHLLSESLPEAREALGDWTPPLGEKC